MCGHASFDLDLRCTGANPGCFLIKLKYFTKTCLSWQHIYRSEVAERGVRSGFHILSNHWPHCGIFENGVLLMYTLEDLSTHISTNE